MWFDLMVVNVLCMVKQLPFTFDPVLESIS